MRLAEAAAALNAATGGAALCRIGGTGGTAKALEGRVAALQEVRRALRDDPDADLQIVLDRWSADLAVRRKQASSAAWLEYLEAGVAEITGLLRSGYSDRDLPD